MTLSELIDDVQSVIQDTAWTDAMITALINRGLLLVATGVMIPGKYQLTPPLPDLYTVDITNTVLSSGVCDMPDDFNRDLVQVLNASKENIPVYPSFRQFLTQNPEQDAGAVRCCARQGATLLYRDIPAIAETLTLHYYATPTTLVADGDIPDCIPTVLHHPLLVGYTCSQIFNQIEDGIEGQKINTNFWNQEFQQGLISLEFLVGIDGDPNHYEASGTRID